MRTRDPSFVQGRSSATSGRWYISSSGQESSNYDCRYTGCYLEGNV